LYHLFTSTHFSVNLQNVFILIAPPNYPDAIRGDRMARKIRIENAGFHHILNRGVEGKVIFWYHTR